MKIVRNGKVYLQKRDISYIANEYTPFARNIRYKLAELCDKRDVSESDDDDFVEITDRELVNRLSRDNWFVDFDDVKTLGMKDLRELKNQSFAKYCIQMDDSINSGKFSDNSYYEMIRLQYQYKQIENLIRAYRWRPINRWTLKWKIPA